MPFLALNGIEIPVRTGSLTRALKEIGARSRAFDGTARVTRRTTKREHHLEMIPQAQADAVAFEGLIQGEGHVWDFATLYSSKGLGPSAQSGTVSVGTPGTPKYSTALTLSGSSVASSISYQPGIGTYWSVAYWRSVDNGGTWTHFVRTSAGTSYINGVFTPGATAWLTVSAPNLSLGDTAATAVRYDDLIFLPYVVPATWPALIYGYGSAWPSLPKLVASGDAFSEAQTVLGEVTDMKQLNVMGLSNARVLMVSLVEV